MKKQTDAALRGTSRRAVILYSAVLFAVVIFFIALSYFIDRRSDHAIAALYEQNNTALQKIELLQTENVDLRAANAQFGEELSASAARIEELEAEAQDIRRQWAEDTKRTEDKYKEDYNELLRQYNELLAQSKGTEAT